MLAGQQQWSPTSVQVTVLQARGLRTKGKGGTNDAYALMQVGKEKYQTSVVRSVAPAWKEEAAFDLPAAERGTLQVHVLHRALVGPDKLLGKSVVDLPRLREDRARNKTEWFKLMDKTGKADKERGEVLLDIQFTRNNMTSSMFDLSAAGKSRSRLGKFKDKVRGKKKESDVASTAAPSFTQVLTDSEGEEEGDGEVAAGKEEKKKKIKSLFSPKSNLQRNMSQSMSVLPAKNSTLSGSQSSGLNVNFSEGKKFKFTMHKRSGSSESKEPPQKQVEQSNLCINGSHVYCEEPQTRTSRIGSNFSLASSGHGSMEDVPESSPPSVDSLRVVRQYSPWTEEEEEEEEVEVKKEEDVEDAQEKMASEEDEQERGEDEIQREEEERVRREETRAQEEEKRRLEEEERVRRQKEERERLAEEKRRLEEEERVRRQEEERQRLAEEKRRLEEEERRKIDEEKVRKEEEERVRRQEEEKVRKEEEERVRRQEEEKERLAAEKRRVEEEERRKIDEEKARKEEEERTRREEEKAWEEQRKHEEEERLRRQEEERERLAEERRRLEEEERRKIDEEKARKEEEERTRREEEKVLEEQKKHEEEERLRRQEEEIKRLAEEKRRLEEERRKIDEEKARKEEEERNRREEEKAREEQRRQEEEEREEQERRQREQEERIRKEEERKQMEEEKARKEREEYERSVEEKRKLKERRDREEAMRKEEEAERVRRQEDEEEKRRMEEEAKKQREEEERVRKEKEECERLEEEKRKQVEQETRKEEERLRMEEERAEEERKRRRWEEEGERTRREQETEKSAAARRPQGQYERIGRGEEEQMGAEEREVRKEEAPKPEAEKTEGGAEGLEGENKTGLGHNSAERSRGTGEKPAAAGVASNNPLGEITNSPAAPESSAATESTGQQRCESPEPLAISAEARDIVVSQREKRQAPRPPGRNQAERQIQGQREAPSRQLDKQDKDEHVKAAGVAPRQAPHPSTPLSRSPTGQVAPRAARHTKRPAPTAPPSADEKPLPEPPAASSPDGSISHRCCSGGKKKVHVLCGLNPFEDDEDEVELRAGDEAAAPGDAGPTRWPPAAAQAPDKDAASQTRVKSSKVAQAPRPPAKTPDKRGADGGSGAMAKPARDPEAKGSLTLQSAGDRAAGDKEGPQPASCRLQPVKPLNPEKIQSVSAAQREKEPFFDGVQEKTKANYSVVKGPYALLTQQELVSLVLKQESQLLERDKKISELEQYIDNLLVRVIEEQPSILMSMNSLKKAA